MKYIPCWDIGIIRSTFIEFTNCSAVELFLCRLGRFVILSLPVIPDLIQKKVEEAKRLMHAEIESERSHHQKLVKDYGRLVQRFENLQGDMQLLSPTKPGHQRSLSGISNISLESESSVATERTEVTGEKPEEGEDVCINAWHDAALVFLITNREKTHSYTIYIVICSDIFSKVIYRINSLSLILLHIACMPIRHNVCLYTRKYLEERLPLIISVFKESAYVCTYCS